MRPRAERRPTAAVALVLLIAVAAGWVTASWQSGRRRDLRADLTSSARQLFAARATLLQAQADDVGRQLAQQGPRARPPAGVLDDALGVRVVVDARFTVEPEQVLAQGQFPAGVLKDESLRAAAQLSVDRGDPVATTARSGSDAVTVVLWPLFRRAGVVTTEQRRSSLRGWLVAAVPRSALAGAVTQPLAPVAEQVSFDGPQAGAPDSLARVLTSTYRVEAGPSDAAATAPVSVALLVLLAGLGGVLARTRHGRRGRAHDVRVAELQRQLGMLAELGATAQSGLDVSLTLPAVLAQLQSGLQLDHMVIRAGPGDGTEILALGVRPEQGVTLSYPLHRALRTIGVLEVTSRDPLPAESQQTLLSAADIVGGFLHNSELFEREQLAVARLQNLDRLKDDFLGTVSHELRTPLAIIVGFLSMLRSRYGKMTDEERGAAFATISNHASALTALVNDLLDFVTDRRGSDQLQLVPLALGDPVGEILERFQPLLAEHRVRPELAGDVVVTTDQRSIERILTNLLSNAVKYSPAGSDIEVAVCSMGDAGALVVRDHGPGIAHQDRELVFERFYRGTTDAARTTRGTGIGLTIVKTWLELVGARLEVRSRPGDGTEMTVVFPGAQGAPVDEAGQIVWRESAASLTGGVPT